MYLNFKKILSNIVELTINTKGFVIGSIVQQLLLIISLPIFAIILEPKEIGVFLLFTTQVLVISHLCCFGFTQSIIKQANDINKKDLKSYLSSIYCYSSIITIGIFILLYLTRIITSDFILSKVLMEFYPYTALTFLYVFLEIPFNIFLAKYRSLNDYKRYNIYIVLSTLISIIISIILIHFMNYGVLGRIFGSILTYSVFYLFIIFKKYLTLNFNKNYFIKAFKFGSFLALQWLYLEYYNFYCFKIIEENMEKDFLGVLSIHRSLALQIPLFIVSSIELALVPLYLKFCKTNNKSKFNNLFYTYIVLYGIFCIIYGLLYNLIHSLLFDVNYSKYMWVGIIFILSSFLRSLMFIPLYYQYVKNKTQIVMYAFVISTSLMFFYIFLKLENLSRIDVILIIIMPNILNTIILTIFKKRSENRC